MEVILTMFSQRCADCSHFHRHYVEAPTILNGPYAPCWFGHCSRKHIKICRCGDVCEHFCRRAEA